jgi:hypothetical protein
MRVSTESPYLKRPVTSNEQARDRQFFDKLLAVSVKKPGAGHGPFFFRATAANYSPRNALIPLKFFSPLADALATV